MNFDTHSASLLGTFEQATETHAALYTIGHDNQDAHIAEKGETYLDSRGKGA